MTHKTPDGYTILLPDMDIHALVNASRAGFVQELLTRNPTLPATQLTKHNLLCCFTGRIARLGQGGPFSTEVKAQIQIVQQRWLSSTAGDVLHELFDGKLRKIGTYLPPSVSSTASASVPKTQKSSNTMASIVPTKVMDPRATGTKPPATAPSVPERVGSNQSPTLLDEGFALIPLKSPYNRNVVVQMPHFLGQHYRKKLVQSGNCLLISLPSETAHALPTKTTHAHLCDGIDQAESLRRIQLVLACYPSIVLAYDSKANKDLAARQIGSLKFQFEDNDPIKVDVQEFGDNPASAKATYTLGPGFLYYCDHRESLQRFFCKEGFVPITDIIRTRRTGVLRIELLIRYRFSPGFLEKLNALPGGHGDNRIPTEPAESCSLCARVAGQDRRHSSPKDAHLSIVTPSSLRRGNDGASAENSARPCLSIPGPALAAAHPSLDDFKITSYIAVFTLLNGSEVARKVPPRRFVRGFNLFLDTFYPDSDFEARLAVLHRIDGGERVDDWELLCKHLRRYFTKVYMSDGKVVGSKRKTLAGDNGAARKMLRGPVAADYM
ncbi:hypothetical protein HO133_008874 [Letharia lupina]|uniref:Uncharacterized protein n=1 Tax=Letharia lupina TaxID=560253 RepID=A0A8H6CPF5_9LECA|nr:uncharacterized protein HO133_008874 [Letharia lupina]KAF6227430.1 hypothetical protein HO133_008874 [Letharia lupina]